MKTVKTCHPDHYPIRIVRIVREELVKASLSLTHQLSNAKSGVQKVGARTPAAAVRGISAPSAVWFNQKFYRT